MRSYLKGREKALTVVGGLVVPGFMIVVFLLAPLWGWRATYVILKVATVFFAVTAMLWYLADDAYEEAEEVEPEDLSADDSGSAGGRRASDRTQTLPVAVQEAHDEPGPQTYVFRGVTGGSEGLKERGLPRESALPGDAQLFREYDGWALYSSASAKALFIRTTDYHPKPLRLTEEVLSELLESLRMESKDP